jgi:hypothetical protein
LFEKCKGSSGNGNTLIQHEDCEAIFNKTKCEKIMEETQENSNLQTKESKALENYEEKNDFFFWNYYIPKKKQLRPHDRNASYWSFYCVNDNGKVTFHDAPQIIHYMFLLFQSYVFF